MLNGFTLITQNVDGLHQRAGSRDVIEVHGSIVRNICHRTHRDVDLVQLPSDGSSPPRSPHHPEGLVRPAVVWFGEALPRDALESAIHASSCCDVFFSIGTSSLVQPAASLAEIAKQAGSLVVEINPESTPLSPQADIVLQGKSGEILPRILELLEQAA